MDGEMVWKNIDPWELPFDRLLNAIYVWFLGERDETEKAKFDAKLWIPPAGVPIPPESPWSPENETAAFQAFKTSMAG